MKLTHYLYIATLTLLAACSSNDEQPNAAEHPDGEILLTAGIAEGGAITRSGAEENHNSSSTYGGHKTLQTNTKLALRVSGTWKSTEVVKTTTATVGAETATNSKHNKVTTAPTLYWDDYGTADPDNTAGRAEGLTIYGAAVDGKTTIPEVTAEQWTTGLPWTLAANQTTAEWKPADKDLLISNNVQTAPGATTSNDGTYKFADYIAAPTTYTKLLEFRHALSKVTVYLKPGEGFNGAFTSTTVQLTSNEANKTENPEWAYTKGVVNITTGAVTGLEENTVVTMAETPVPTSSTFATNGYTVAKEALVMPGSTFASDDAIIARITADGNVYYVRAKEIRAAIKVAESLDATDVYETKAGKNYVLQITVNKTEIKVAATLADWTTVEAENTAPKINVTVNYGTPGPAVKLNTFSFYRSLSLYDGYATGESDDLIINGYYKRVSELTYNAEDKTWTMTPVRYWSEHNQHYHFRLVWPNTTTARKDAKDAERPDEPVQLWRPHVEKKTGNDYQSIDIWNVKYESIDPSKTHIADNYHPYPSNLMIARPEIDPTVTCENKEPGHTPTLLYDGGICATEGVINMTFRYVMSQVEVRLATTLPSDASRVTLANAKVEVVNIDNGGCVKLGDRTVIPNGTPDTYNLDYMKTVTGSSVSDTLYYHSAIVPQTLTYTTERATSNMRFKVTITNSDNTTDVYYADVAPILEKGTSKKVAPNGKWESGVHYVYYLTVSKTRINVTASIEPWTTVKAAENVWF